MPRVSASVILLAFQQGRHRRLPCQKPRHCSTELYHTKKLTAIFYYEAIASNKARPSVTIRKKRYVKLSKHNGLTAIFYNTDLSPLKIYAIITSRDTRHTKNQRFLVFRRTLKYPFGLHPAAQGHGPAFSRAIVLSSSDSIGEQGQQRF